ncbi:hypothetical protein HNR60_000423 [Rhodopseudomonas rhenobacensis]|uniref:Uncharacterized protein n=1 Tax=Rhodopseudomonas rhenobacensis TaxID=87461 RepID=A0A7W7Z0H6_9BRAD|nr:hypothetical protein [Rhodopseudomonas rhenobacensis]MBB5045688.1 hypothetical protein [Rhodopseudomonas rhenobacensis]
MSEHNGPPATLQQRLRWLMTPPQAYLAYALAVLLIGGLSFYAGSLKPNKKSLVPPPAAQHSAPPQN